MSFKSAVFGLLVAMSLLLSACSGPDESDDATTVESRDTVRTGGFAGETQWLTDITTDSGLDFVHDAGVDGSFFMPEIVGSGGAIFDHDNDGDLDLYLIDAGPHGGEPGTGNPNRLYSQEAGMQFVDRTKESGLGDRGYGMGVAVGDMDNDGDLDVFVTNYGADALYRNDGSGTFSDVTAAAGIDSTSWSTSAMFFDYNVDGHLDLYVATYVTNRPPKACTSGSGRKEYCGPNAYRGTSDLLYRNNGDGTFTDVSNKSDLGETPGKGLGVVASDFDGDGRGDVFVANDGEKNHLWIYRDDDRFDEQAVMMGTAFNMFGKPEASMGIALGDVDGDLALDLFLTHLSRETNTLYRALDRGGLQDTTAMSGLGPASLPYTGFGTGFVDADHDGDLDLIVVNGRVTLRDTQVADEDASDNPDVDYLERFRRYYAEPNQIYFNDGAGRFEDGCDRAPDFCSRTEVSRGAVFGDIDADGDLDVLVTNSNSPAYLYRNDIPSKGNWIKVRAWLPDLKRDAVGALVYAETTAGRIVRPVSHTYSYLASADAVVHFGLGAATRVETFTVHWPDGVTERFSGADAGTTVRLNRGEGNVNQ